VSQIVSHTLRFHRQSTRPRSMLAEELIEPSLGLFVGRLTSARIELIVEHRDSSPIVCYEGEVRQVLNNLISNAMESMRAGGKLFLRSGRARSWQTGQSGLGITVADTGYGISDAVRSRLFEPFYTTKGENGTGLGLWISRGIVDKHQGTLQVRSSVRPGASGSVFRIFLPSDPFESTAASPDVA
jgi:signal transduction histidine kinase